MAAQVTKSICARASERACQSRPEGFWVQDIVSCRGTQYCILTAVCRLTLGDNGCLRSYTTLLFPHSSTYTGHLTHCH